MAEAPAVFTISANRPFADALAAGLIARAGGDAMRLARGTVLIASNRAARAISDAFVRRSGGGLLLPRLVAIGDEALEDALGAALDPADDEPLPPAIDPMRRRMILARLIAEERAKAGDAIETAEAMRLAQAFGRALDELGAYEVPYARLADLDVAEYAEHWQRALGVMGAVLARWPGELARVGAIEPADRRNRQLDRVARRWRATPPAGFVAAAGIFTATPAAARLLRTVARLSDGLVVLPALDLAMPDAEWDALAPADGPAQESHPQVALRRLLDDIGVARGEVRPWRGGASPAAPAVRARALANAMAPPAFTAKWEALPPAERRLTGVRAFTAATPAEEAQAIAIAIRHAIEEPRRTAALVTADRGLARRVAAHLARWGIAADDSAGRPLSATPPGTLIVALAHAAASRFAPVELLTLLKHPLVAPGGDRAGWLARVRRLDRRLRGPRPAPGLDGIPEAGDWWQSIAAILRPVETAFAVRPTLADALAAIRDGIAGLAGDAAWAGPAGRAAARLFEAVEAAAPDGPAAVAPQSLAPLLGRLLDEVAVRPPQGGHPRVFIWGLIESRLQSADFVVAGGLNEGVWPALPGPDPWLGPRIRADLGLPGVEHRIGLSAHDFVGALGAPRVLVTRARRDATAPTVASRLWLRLEAMTGGVTPERALGRWAAAIDRPESFRPACRPAPAPPAAARPREIAVTSLDRLKADPFAFYAQAILRLRRLDPVDAEPTPAWRGTAVHKVLEDWATHDACDPALLPARAEAMLAEIAAHPVMRALWTPRLREAIAWIAARMAEHQAAGRAVLAAETKGTIAVAGVTLTGKADRIDRTADGALAIVDYKTGTPPKPRAVAAGYAMQLGLIGLIAERGGFDGIAGRAGVFEYWSLAQKDGQLGHIAPALGKRPVAEVDDFTALAHRQLEEAAGRWLTGDEPFTAKLHPEYAPYADYDQLMRLDEWYGRQAAGGGP